MDAAFPWFSFSLRLRGVTGGACRFGGIDDRFPSDLRRSRAEKRRRWPSSKAPIAVVGQFAHNSIMTEVLERYVRWEPIASLPAHPYRSVHIDYNGERLVATAFYAADPLMRRILIDFGKVEAFKLNEEFSDPWNKDTRPQPRIEGGQWSGWTWPLQQVLHSSWIERVLSRNGGIENLEWLHYIVVTTDMTLHVMIADAPHDVRLLS